MIIVINYANEKFTREQKYNTKTAYKRGKADLVLEFGPKDIDEDFRNKNQHILGYPRGGGYWLWKPYFVRRVLMDMSENDYLMYCDSGAYFIDNISKLINRMEELNCGGMFFAFPEGFDNTMWTKRDMFVLMDCDVEKYHTCVGVSATFFILKKTNKIISVVEEWLEYASDRRIITDEENVMGLDNYANFVENRHDQAILTLLVAKNNFHTFRDPSQYGNPLKHKERFIDDNYPQIVCHYRGWKCYYPVLRLVYWLKNRNFILDAIFTFLNRLRKSYFLAFFRKYIGSDK